jgi:hypothetical protein
LGKAVWYVTFMSHLDLTLLLCNVECSELNTALGIPCTSFFKVCPIVYCTSVSPNRYYSYFLPVSSYSSSFHTTLPQQLICNSEILKEERNNKEIVGWALLSRCFVYFLMTEHMSVSVTVTHFDLLADHCSFPLICKRVKYN